VPSIYMLVAKTHTAIQDEDEERITLRQPIGAGV
jgi:hypothetical protein